jgi:drug/metabolite transporter (DMT)-like permease
MTSATLTSPARKAYLVGLTIAVVGAIFFSAKSIIAKLAYQYQVDAVTIIALRMLFAFPFFLAIAAWKARTEPALSNPDRLQIVMMGLLGYYLSSFLDFLGLQYISAGMERLILFLTPSFVLLLSMFFLKKKISLVEWGALGAAYLGTVLVFIQDVRTGGSHVVLGSLLVLGSAVLYAVYLILSGAIVARVGAVRLVAYAMCVSSVACVAQFFFLRPVSMLMQPVAVYWLSIVNAVFCTVLPVIMTMVAVARIGPATVSQAGMIGPVSTIFMGVLILGEPLTAIQMAGTALVLSGIFLLTKKKT